jgi:hypothetical protein
VAVFRITRWPVILPRIRFHDISMPVMARDERLKAETVHAILIVIPPAEPVCNA